LEIARDESREGLRLFAALRDVLGKREEMTSADICAALHADSAGEWADSRESRPRFGTFIAVLVEIERELDGS
jgi:hypothetical protein